MTWKTQEKNWRIEVKSMATNGNFFYAFWGKKFLQKSRWLIIRLAWGLWLFRLVTYLLIEHLTSFSWFYHSFIAQLFLIFLKHLSQLRFLLEHQETDPLFHLSSNLPFPSAKAPTSHSVPTASLPTASLSPPLLSKPLHQQEKDSLQLKVTAPLEYGLLQIFMSIK